MGYTVEHDKMLSKIHGYDVYTYSCNGCGEEIDSNGNFDKTPNMKFCPNCGEELKND